MPLLRNFEQLLVGSTSDAVVLRLAFFSFLALYLDILPEVVPNT